MNTLRESDGYPPVYPTAQDSEVPVLVSNQGRLMVSQRPAGLGMFGVMCAENYVKLPYFKADQVRISNTSGKEAKVTKTWDKQVLANFDTDLYTNGQSINGVNGWEGNGVTTPDSTDSLRFPIMEILQGRRSVYVDDKITKQGLLRDGVVPDGSKVTSLFRPRLQSRMVGLGIYDGSKNLIVGIYTKDKKFGIYQDGGDIDTNISVESEIVRLEIVFAPTAGLLKYYAHQNGKRILLSESTTDSIKPENLAYASYRVGAEGEGAIVDEFKSYLFRSSTLNFEVLPSSSSVIFSLEESTDELMIQNIGSMTGNYIDNTDPIFLTGFYEES